MSERWNIKSESSFLSFLTFAHLSLYVFLTHSMKNILVNCVYIDAHVSVTIRKK